MSFCFKGFYEHCARLGLLPTGSDVDALERPLDVEYLQQRFYLAIADGVVTRMPGNRIARILFRTFWTREVLRPAKAKGLARGMCLSLRLQNSHVPLVNDLIERILFLTEGAKVYYDADWISRIRSGSITVSQDRVAYQEHPMSVQEIADHIGATVQELWALRYEIAGISFGELFGSHETAGVVTKLMAWDF